jgi:hypothetical protein
MASHVRKAALLAALLGLASLAETPDAEASRRRIQGRASVQRAANVQAPPYTASLIREVYDGEDRDVGTAAGYLQYRHQPSCVISAVSRDILCAHRAGTSHSSETDQIVITRSTDRGITWTDRRNELTVFADNVNFQEIAALGTGTGNRLWLTGSDVNNAPLPATRVCWTSYSDDDGLTWTAKSFNIPNPGTSFTTCGGGMGVYTANNGDLVTAGYWQDTATAPRYTSGIFRSTNNGVTWTITATLAGTSGTTQWEEPNCRRLQGTSTHVCLLRVDNEPTSCTGAACGYIYVTRSTDDGATWSTPAVVFNGRGTPAWGELTNGVLVAGNRSRGNGTFDDPNEGWRGQIYYSYDDGLTWAGGAEFQSPIDGPVGPNDMRGGPYMGASFVECDTNVACAMSAQEPGLVAYAQGGLYWRYLAWNGESTPFYSDFATSQYALRYPSGGGAYLDYGTTGTLNGATNWVATFRWRYPYTASDLTNPTGDQVVISRHPAGQRHLDIRVGASQRLYVYTGATLSTLATFTSASLTSQITNAPWVHVTVVYDGTQATNATRLRTYIDGVEITAGGSYSGTIPASMTVPTTARWQVGANAGANTARGVVDDIAIWAGASAICGPVCVERLFANGSPGDYRTSEMGNPSVYLDFESSTYADLMGNWGTPAVTGSIGRSQRAGAIRFGNDLTVMPGWFVSTLAAPGQAIALREDTATGASSPYYFTPSGTTWTESGVDWLLNVDAGCGACTAPTVSTSLPNYTQLVSTDSVLGTAGIFLANFGTGLPRPLAVSAGWTMAAHTRYVTNVLGDRGALAMVATNYDTVNFEPCQAIDVVGYCHDSGNAVADGWRFCTDTNTCTNLGTAAPRDGRDYYALMSVEAGATTGYSALIDLANRHYPRISHENTAVTLPATGGSTYTIEINASPGPLVGAPQIPHTFRIYRVRGALAYAPP